MIRQDDEATPEGGPNGEKADEDVIDWLAEYFTNWPAELDIYYHGGDCFFWREATEAEEAEQGGSGDGYIARSYLTYWDESTDEYLDSNDDWWLEECNLYGWFGCFEWSHFTDEDLADGEEGSTENGYYIYRNNCGDDSTERCAKEYVTDESNVWEEYCLADD